MLRFFALALVVTGCANEIPSAATASPSDESNIPSGASGFAQVQAELGARRATALAEIGEAKRAIRTAADDCSAECPLVGSLHLGVDHLCGIDDNHEDGVRCKEQKAIFANIEARVKRDCHGCQNGGKPTDSDDAGY